MANGDYFSPDELREYIKPLELIRERIDGFAQSEGLEAIYYFKGWPYVKLEWSNSFDLKCTVDLGMEDDKSTFNLGIAAWKDMDKK